MTNNSCLLYAGFFCGASCDYFPNLTPHNQSRVLVAEEVKKLREKISDLKVQISCLRGHNPTSKLEMVGGQNLKTGSNNNTRRYTENSVTISSMNALNLINTMNSVNIIILHNLHIM